MAGIGLELHERGSGEPVLFMHAGLGFDRGHAVLDHLARGRRVIAPSHPGFGGSDLPDWMDSVEDIAHLYLGLLDALDLRRVELVGCSIGAWIAAELASMVPERILRLVLAGPLGVKMGPTDKLDVPDIYVIGDDALNRLLYHDPEAFRLNPTQLSDNQLAIALRNRESMALFAWEPYMHNPKLKQRLYRATMPALLIRGASDGLVSRDYLQGFAGLFPDSRTAVIDGAGHLPHIEQPERLASIVLSFLDERASQRTAAA